MKSPDPQAWVLPASEAGPQLPSAGASLPSAGASLPPVEAVISAPLLLDLLRSVLARDLPFRFQACGSSMTPFIRSGDILTLEGLRSRCPQVGEVLAFEHPLRGSLVVHRAVWQRGGAWFLRGDGCAGRQGDWVPASLLLARLVRIQRGRATPGLGLGRERWLIAQLSRWGLLAPARSLYGLLSRRWVVFPTS